MIYLTTQTIEITMSAKNDMEYSHPPTVIFWKRNSNNSVDEKRVDVTRRATKKIKYRIKLLD